eukprot:994464_1
MQREMGRKRLADGDKQSRNRKSQKSQSSSLISSCSGQSSVNRSDNVYEEQAKRVCKICCETKNDGLFHDRRGGRCADIFCKECVGSFVRVRITEGAVTHIKCPGIGCNRVMKEIVRRMLWLNQKCRSGHVSCAGISSMLTLCQRNSAGKVFCVIQPNSKVKKFSIMCVIQIRLDALNNYS